MDGVVNNGFPVIHVKVDVMPEESCCFLLAAVPAPMLFDIRKWTRVMKWFAVMLVALVTFGSFYGIGRSFHRSRVNTAMGDNVITGLYEMPQGLKGIQFVVIEEKMMVEIIQFLQMVEFLDDLPFELLFE